jgi:hypothetical protein
MLICAAGLLVFALFLAGWSVGHNPRDATISTLEDMQVDPPADYIHYLSEVISSHSDPYVRERAVFTLTDISLRRDESASVRPILLKIAQTSQDTDLQSAAFSNLDLIDKVVPVPPKTEMNLTVDGRIRQGQTITVNITLTSTVMPVKVLTGIRRIPKGLVLESPPSVRTALKQGEPVTIPFQIKILQDGEYELPFSSSISYSRVEKENLERTLYLAVKDGDIGRMEIQ